MDSMRYATGYNENPKDNTNDLLKSILAYKEKMGYSHQ
jgi:hypothetical protein